MGASAFSSEHEQGLRPTLTNSRNLQLVSFQKQVFCGLVRLDAATRKCNRNTRSPMSATCLKRNYRQCLQRCLSNQICSENFYNDNPSGVSDWSLPFFRSDHSRRSFVASEALGSPIGFHLLTAARTAATASGCLPSFSKAREIAQ
jgi:hypothetical protein